MEEFISTAVSNSKIVITPTHLFQYAIHPRWIWYDRFEEQAKKEPLSEFSQKIMQAGVLHEEAYVANLTFSAVNEKDPITAFFHTLELMKKGEKLIYQGCIQFELDGVVYRGRPDLLEKKSGKSIFGDWLYVPIDIKSSMHIKTLHKQQLIFYAMILQNLQGCFPHGMGIINKECNFIAYQPEKNNIAATQADVDKVLEIMKGKKPDSTINGKTKDSPWYKLALEEAEKSGDISLIYCLLNSSMEALRATGIRSIYDLAEVDISKLPPIPHASVQRLKKFQLQAQSLIKNEIIQLGRPKPLPQTELTLYFDIEGDPFLNVDYLFGFWVSGDAERKYAQVGNHRFYPGEESYFLYFIAEQPEEEAFMWCSFLEWVESLPKNYIVYHYASYEKTHLTVLSRKYSTSSALHYFQTKLIDLLKIVLESYIFPLYFYSIKDIAKSKFLDFQWRHQKAGGGQSIFWYEQWLETGKHEILQDIIDYNEDDVRATEFLYQWLKKQESKG